MTSKAREKSALAYSLKMGGLKYKEIGVRMGISEQRAGQLCRAEKWWINRDPHWMDGLSVRTGNCLNNIGVNSREEALEAYQSGMLSMVRNWPRNYGWKSHKEVASWLGLPEPQKPPPRVKVVKTCPHCGGRLK